MIRVEKLHFQVGNPARPGAGFALRDVSLDVAAGQYFVLLGPTGSGKSLLVECLCGLNRVHAGRIRIGGKDVTGWEPRRRRIGYLPQDYALFPHLTVRQNVAFGPRLRRDGAAGAAAVEELMEKLGIAHLAGRLPQRLSGGEKQRVALARALAVRPDVLLLDEPVSALDEATRDATCRLLKQLQRETGTTTVHVCHNFQEMLAVADRVGIIHQGRILQVGPPGEVLKRPSSRVVAEFVQTGNLLPARATKQGGLLWLQCAGGIELWSDKKVTATKSGERGGDGQDGEGKVTAAVRPEYVRLLDRPPPDAPPGSQADAAVLPGRVVEVVDLGPILRVHVGCGEGAELLASLSRREAAELGIRPGGQVYLSIAAEDVHVIADRL
jgi:molybdopterin-binding protein